jgi:hypothetical protein
MELIPAELSIATRELKGLEAILGKGARQRAGIRKISKDKLLLSFGG